MSIRCIKFRAYQKNTLKGFCHLELTRVGIVIHDCTWHAKDGKEWVGFPARSYQANDGKTQWQPLVEFSEHARDARRSFQEQAITAIHVAAKESAG